MATGQCGKASVGFLMHVTRKSRLLRIRDMSSLQDMSNFLFMSMTGPKEAEGIQVVFNLLHEAKPVLGLF